MNAESQCTGGTAAELTKRVKPAIDVIDQSAKRAQPRFEPRHEVPAAETAPSVTGDIRYAGSPAPGGIVDLSDHSGGVELLLPADASAALELTSVAEPSRTGSPALAPPWRRPAR